MPDLPYRSLRVLDFTDVWAGPMAGSLLGDLGADVVRIESYPRPSILRPLMAVAGMPGLLGAESQAHPSWERSVRYYTANRNKRAIALNIKDPRGDAVLSQLCAQADVFLESYASGVIAKLGFGWERVHALNPRTIMISMSAWGHGGPYHGYRAMGGGIDASVGHPYLRGYADTDVGATVQAYPSDASAAVTALFATGVALWQRRRTGIGSWVDLAQAEVLLAHMPGPLLELAAGAPHSGALENHHPVFAPYGAFRCAGPDDWLQICVRTQEEWLGACDVLAPSLAHDERFTTPLARRQHRAELEDLIAAATAERNVVELMDALQERGVPAGAVYRNEQVAADRQLNARNFLRLRDHKVAGRRLLPSYAWRMGDTPEPEFRPANTFGEHNEELLHELGYDDDAIRLLYEDGVIANTFANVLPAGR